MEQGPHRKPTTAQENWGTEEGSRHEAVEQTNNIVFNSSITVESTAELTAESTGDLTGELTVETLRKTISWEPKTLKK